MATLLQDLRYAVRVLRKSPGFTITAVLTLALAIGANAIVFGIFDGMILRPLNVPQAENLYGTQYGENPGWQSYPNYLDLRDRNHSFESLAATNFAFVGFDTGKNPSFATGYATSGNYFDVLRIQPYLGRFFHGADERGPNSVPYVVLAYAYWHSHFQDDRGVVGRTVLLNKHPFTIIGVAPPGFHGTVAFAFVDFFMPIVNEGQLYGGDVLDERGSNTAIFEIFGHLKPGVTLAQASADVNAVGGYLEKSYPKDFSHKSTTLARQGLTAFGGAAKAFLAGLMVLSGLILLAACANLGSLFAARTADRSREVALRLALGSSRNRILRQILTEAMLIALAGGAAGVFVSVALLRRLSNWQPFPAAPAHLPVAPDAKVYFVALFLALVSGLLFAIVPLRQVLGANPYEIVKAGMSARMGRRVTVRDVLLVVQIVICAVLVTSSLVAVRGLARSLHSNYGFEPRNAMMLNIDLAQFGYSGEQASAMNRRIFEAMGTIPGVERVGWVNDYPPLAYGSNFRFNIYRDETSDLRKSNAAAMPFRYNISPGYFEAAKTSLLTGRSINWSDEKGAPAVAVINREFAVKIFGSVSGAVGRNYKLQDGTRVQVVGVVEDGKYLSLNEDPQPAMFLPALQSPSSHAYMVVRSSRDPEQLTAAMRGKLRELDAGLSADIETWNEVLALVLFPSRMATMALGVLGLMGAMLSITGIFGMAAYAVSKRLRELGLRMTPGDPLVLGGVLVAMIMLGLVATWIPAQRALSVNPMILLREE
ncbi:MAG: ABC transporter permease [Terracidiphilus sp.]